MQWIGTRKVKTFLVPAVSPAARANAGAVYITGYRPARRYGVSRRPVDEATDASSVTAITDLKACAGILDRDMRSRLGGASHGRIESPSVVTVLALKR